MLKKLNSIDMSGTEIKICDAKFPEPFVSGLEYNAPARGNWNIVHTGFLIPESHQIFACARGCLRGVVLTAAEMNAMDRMSWISLSENDLFDGTLETNIIDGVCDILSKMAVLPRAVLVFISCVHLFAGCDFKMIIEKLSERFPEIDFIDCYMNPTMRKSGLTPDQIMRKQLYLPLKNQKHNRKAVNIIGNDRPTDNSSELISILKDNGFEVRDITLCKNYDEYLKMGESAFNITYLPTAFCSGEELEKRLSQKHLYLPLSYSFDEIESNIFKLCETLNIKKPSLSEAKDKAETALKKAKSVVFDTPIEIDYTATPRPLGLARLLLSFGFNVKKIYADAFSPEEKKDFIYLKENAKEIEISPTVNVKMRFKAHENTNEKILAIGQKAAYFGGTHNFVNIVSGGGMYGFNGIVRLSELIIEAFFNEKDTKTVISHKGLGCESCL